MVRYQARDFATDEQLVAEHGFSAFVSVEHGSDRRTVPSWRSAHSLLLDGAVLASGQVERVTELEAGFPVHEARNGDGCQPDPMIWDDQALVTDDERPASREEQALRRSDYAAMF